MSLTPSLKACPFMVSTPGVELIIDIRQILISQISTKGGQNRWKTKQRAKARVQEVWCISLYLAITRNILSYSFPNPAWTTVLFTAPFSKSGVECSVSSTTSEFFPIWNHRNTWENRTKRFGSTGDQKTWNPSPANYSSCILALKLRVSKIQLKFPTP